MKMPTTVAKEMTTAPTFNDARAPQMMRLSMSRPSWSVPSGCSQLPPSIHAGGAKRLRKLGSVGSWGAIHGANKPMIMTSSSTTPPTTASRFLLNRRQKSASCSRVRAHARRRAARPSTGVVGVAVATCITPFSPAKRRP
jgi:hypothetical protein